MKVRSTTNFVLYFFCFFLLFGGCFCLYEFVNFLVIFQQLCRKSLNGLDHHIDIKSTTQKSLKPLGWRCSVQYHLPDISYPNVSIKPSEIFPYSLTMVSEPWYYFMGWVGKIHVLDHRHKESHTKREVPQHQVWYKVHIGWKN
jgi:hypothetical protein